MVGCIVRVSSDRVYHEVMFWSVAVMWMFALCANTRKVAAVGGGLLQVQMFHFLRSFINLLQYSLMPLQI